MGKIFYGVSGEGRGHATRARTLTDELTRQGHEVVLFASGLGFELLAPTYLRPRVLGGNSGGSVELRRVPGLSFHYSTDKRLAYGKTGWHAARYMRQLPSVLATLSDQIEEEEPDLVVTDFEPALPRAARRTGVPFISLDHQHFLVTYDLSSLSWSLRCHAAFMGSFCAAFCRGQAHTMVSSFYFPPLRSDILRQETPTVSQIGVLLRPEILHAQPTMGGHLVAYLRRFSRPHVLQYLDACGVEVRVYGLGEQPVSGNLRFMGTDLTRFAEDLSTSRGLVSTAGNQLMGEALYLGKPVLAMPEPGNREQQINAHFLARSGGGLSVEMERLEASHLSHLLEGEMVMHPLDRQRLCGNSQAVDWVHQYLSSRGKGSNVTSKNGSPRTSSSLDDLPSVA